jgi:hypothetical protein
MVPLHWKTNDDKCWFTIQQNQLLEINDMYGFRDPCLILTNRQSMTAGTGGLRDKLYYIYFIGSIMATVAMIFMKIRK